MAAARKFLGRAIRDFANRDEVVVATKVYFPLRKGLNARGLSRKAIMTDIDASLQRLGMDYVDLYQIHRWDHDTPIEVTLEALHDVVKAGKARYIGASSMFAWQFCKALYLADQHGWTRFATMQDHYNLLHREEEREMLPLCAGGEDCRAARGAHWREGRLARAWNESTNRLETDEYGKKLYVAAQRCGPSRGRARRRDRKEAWCSARADRAGVAAAQAGGYRADRGRLQTAASRRRYRRALLAFNPGGNCCLGRTLRSASRRGVRMIQSDELFTAPCRRPSTA